MKLHKIFISRKTLELVNNSDALSMEVTIFRNGGTDCNGEALPCVVIEE
jgi:hypothetical protein